MRSTLIVIHRWVALTIGVVLIVTATSGAALVFEGAIDRGLHPRLWHVTPAGKTLPFDSLVARVEGLERSPVSSIAASSVRDRAWTLSAGSLTVFVDPYTGEIKGTRTAEESLTTFSRRLHILHVELFAGRRGRAVVGALCAIALFLVLTGILLWWPDKLIGINTTGNWKRLNFDLHHALGICAAIILIVITASGVVIHYDGIGKMIRSMDAVPPPPPPTQPSGPPTAQRLSFDTVAAVARRALPGAEIMFMAAGGAKNPAVAAMRFPEDHTPGGRSRVYIDRLNGNVLSVVSTREAQIGTRIDNLKRSLHTGDVLGKPTELIWFVATLVLVSQVITGALMWWNARAARKKASVASA
jgi:uncharacterized iron-regulated membrane protein